MRQNDCQAGDHATVRTGESAHASHWDLYFFRMARCEKLRRFGKQVVSPIFVGIVDSGGARQSDTHMSHVHTFPCTKVWCELSCLGGKVQSQRPRWMFLHFILGNNLLSLIYFATPWCPMPLFRLSNGDCVCALPATSQETSATGTRTRVARVRAEYPNQLDYSGF